jgi:hypothetical protein
MRVRRTIAVVTMLGVISAVLVGCSNGPDPQTQRDLRDRVAAIRAAAEAGDREATKHRLQQLVDAVESWRTQGAIDDAYAASILTAAAAVEDEVGLLPLPAASSPSTAAPEEERTPPGQEEDHGHGHDEHGNANGNGKGNGNGEGNGND